MNSSQKKAFLEYEANAWFERNKETVLKHSTDDKVVTLLKDYNLDPVNLLEIGCSAGYRLNKIKKIYNNCTANGIEPSTQAIKYGKEHYPEVNFVNGTADDLSDFKDGLMDVIIVGFVFYVIDRNLIFKVVSEIDRVLRNNGVLIIIDFFSETSLKNAYQHIDAFSAFSFKQNYDEIFTASKLYFLLDKSSYDHSKKSLDATDDYYNKYSISLLKKDLNASYK